MPNDDLKDPPVLTDDVDYADWKIDMEIWELYTSLAKTRRGPALYLSLKGNARECVRGLTKEQISAEDGVQTIIKKLDGVMQSDVCTCYWYQEDKFIYKFNICCDISIVRIDDLRPIFIRVAWISLSLLLAELRNKKRRRGNICNKFDQISV